MSRETSPCTIGEFWLDKRRDGRSPKVWQIARKAKGTVIYRSTHCERLEDAEQAIIAFVAKQRSLGHQQPTEAHVIPALMNYWEERGKKLVNKDQTSRSIRTFIGFLVQDSVGEGAVIADLVPALFERFREWRMAPHGFSIPWAGEISDYTSAKGVNGPTVQRNINDIRAAVNYAQANLRIPMAPKIRDLPEEYQSEARERILSMDEIARIAWYASHNPDLFRFVALQFGTAVRPQAAMKFDPRTQYDPATRLIDLQPEATKRTKKRNAVIPAIRPLGFVLRKWAKADVVKVSSRKTAWRIMRRTLGLTPDVVPKTIRHTVATMLYADPTVPEREIVEMLAHEGKLARTTRIYAKYDPNRLGNVTRALTALWVNVHAMAKAYASDHILTTEGQGGKNIVCRKAARMLDSSR